MSAPPPEGFSFPGDPRGVRGTAAAIAIAAVIVSWKDADDVEEAVRSLAAARAASPRRDLAVSLVVVGNGEGSVRADRVEAVWPGATVLVNAENRGLGPAANQAARAAPDADVFLFLNPDTRAEGEVFSSIAAGFEENRGAAALAPRLLDTAGDPPPRSPRPLSPPDREDQFTFQLRRLPRLSSDARELLLVDHLFPDGDARRRARYADEDRERPFAVEQAAAAALAVRADVFRRIGGFDESFVPAWFEDVDLCARLLPHGKILYWPSARFRHAGGASSERLGYARFLPILYGNAIRYRKRHYGRAAAAAYRVLLAAGMALRLALLPFRRRVPRSRTDSARAYISALSTALGFSRGSR